MGRSSHGLSTSCAAGGIFPAARAIAAAHWRIARLLPRAGWAAVLATASCAALLGVLPVVFVLAGSLLLGEVAQARVDPARWPSVVAGFLLASAAFTVQQALAPAQNALSELVARRIDGEAFDRLIAASLHSRGIGPLEDQRLLEHLSMAGYELEQGVHTPGRAAAGLLHLAGRNVQLAGFVIVIGVGYSWVAATGVLVTVLAFRHAMLSGLRSFTGTLLAQAALRRESRYLRELALRATAAKEIRVFGLLAWLRDRYRRAYLAWLGPVWRERRRSLLWPYLRYTLVGLLVTAAVMASAAVAGARGLTVATLVLIVQAVLTGLRLGAFSPEADMQTIGGARTHEAVRAYERGAAAYDVNERTDPPDRIADPPAPREDIRFSEVSFRYRGSERPVFRDLNLRIRAGKCTAIVGLNGAGKTTLVKLLTRLYEPDGGVITVDGVDIRRFPVEAWRARISVVFQDYIRYEATAAENIAFGSVRHAHAREAVRDAAGEAGILGTLDALPGGLDTPLTPHIVDGTDLSGGQWQRVALARALFGLRHGGGVLVLDEPTASLDVRAEARFFDEFVRLTSGATTVMISHRFSTVRRADHIVVLENGRVGEEGSHRELLRRGGRYADLFRLQAARYTDGPARRPFGGSGVPT